MPPLPDARAFLESLVARDVVRLAMKDGSAIEGSYLTQAGMHFVHVRDGTPIGKVLGPVDPDEVASFALLKGRDEVVAEIAERRMGEPVPGKLVETRDGFQARLERLAAAAAAAPDFRRRLEIEAQFDDAADRIQLARTKRNWMLAEAKWRRHSNEEPDRLEMAGGDLTVAARFQRPRPQDFDPDPAMRRRRVPLPDHVASDPRSPHNMMKALRSAGFLARPSLLSELTFDAVDLLVDFPGGKKDGRFLVRGKRGPDGAMRWSMSWEGGDSSAAMRRRLRAVRSEEYALLSRLVLGEKAAPSDDADETASPAPR